MLLATSRITAAVTLPAPSITLHTSAASPELTAARRSDANANAPLASAPPAAEVDPGTVAVFGNESHADVTDVI